MAYVLLYLWYLKMYQGDRYGAVVRAFASHQCGPGLIPGVVVISGFSGFSPFKKSNASEFQFDARKDFKRVSQQKGSVFLFYGLYYKRPFPVSLYCSDV